MSKNINGACYEPINYAMQAEENEIALTRYVKCAGYQTDRINCYELVKYLTDENMIAKTENYMPKQTYLEQVYCFDIEDIKNAVVKRIENLKNSIVALEKEIEIADYAYNQCVVDYNVMINRLQESTCVVDDPDYSNRRNILFYAIAKAVIKSY